MLTIIKLAFRNLGRYRFRSVMTSVAIMITVFISAIVFSLYFGIFEASDFNLIRYESSEVSVYADGYFDDRRNYPVDKLISPDEVSRAAEAFEKKGWKYSPRFKTPASLIGYDEELDFEGYSNAVLVAIDTEKEGDVFSTCNEVIEGKWLTDGEEGVVIGNLIADSLNLSVGDYLTIECSGRGGFAETLDALVIGIFKTEDIVVNRGQIYMSYDYLSPYLALDGYVTEIEVSDGRKGIAKSSFKDSVLEAVSDIPGLIPWYWEEVNDDVVALKFGDIGTAYIVMIFLFILTASGIANTMIMSVAERKRECAMLRSVGFSKNTISLLLMTESALCAVFGSIAGVILSIAANIPLAGKGVDIALFFDEGTDYGYRISLVMRSGWFPSIFAEISALAVAVSVIVAFIAVRASMKHSISEMLRRA